jgi:hypothetical protein
MFVKDNKVQTYYQLMYKSLLIQTNLLEKGLSRIVCISLYFLSRSEMMLQQIQLKYNFPSYAKYLYKYKNIY